MKKTMKIILRVLLVIVLVAVGGFAGFAAYEYTHLIDDVEIKNIETEEDSFKVAVISDTQLPPTEESAKDSDKFIVNFRNTLTVLKNQDRKSVV